MLSPLPLEGRVSALRFLLLPLLSGVLLLLAQPPFSFVLLPFTALVPLVVALGSLAPGSDRKAAWMGVAFGGLYWGALLVWVPLVVAPRFPWAYPGYGVQVGLLGGLSALMAWGSHRLHARICVPLPLAFALAWVAMEWLKAHFPLGLSFPWLGLGISLTPWPELLGMAEWTGEGGVAFWLACVNGVVATGVLGLARSRGGASRRGDLRTRVLILAALAIPLLLGVIRSRNLPLVAGPRVAVVGTDVPADLRLREIEGTREALAQARSILAGVEPGQVELVVLPEATVAVPLGGGEGSSFREELGRMARRLDAPLLVGALGEDPESSVTNSAFLFDSHGTPLARYDKVRLVPGMEWGKYSPGERGQTLKGGDWELAPMVCYESLFGDSPRAQRRGGASILVNLSSDVWFGEAGGVSGVFLRQHPAHLVMRAVETRMAVARAANGGVSLLLGPRGRTLLPSLSPGMGILQARLPVLEGVTFFAITGDLVGPISLFAFSFLLLVSFSRLEKPVHPSA